MSRSRSRNFKGRKTVRGFSMLVHAIWQSPQYAKLSPRAVKLLVDLHCQFRGANNGDLTSAWSVMRKAGWRSKHLLYKAQEELERRGWILKTRKGLRAHGTNSATLWALTFEAIHDCRDTQGRNKLDPGIRADPMPLNLWKAPNYDVEPEPSKRGFQKQKISPRAGPSFPESRANVAAFPNRLSRESGQK